MKLNILVALAVLLLSASALSQPNDPLYSKQKYLKKMDYSSAEAALDQLPDSAIHIGVIDSGNIDPEHPELRGRISTEDFSDEDVEHGQQVVGVIAANKNNKDGGIGLLNNKVLIEYRNVTSKRKDIVRTVNFDDFAERIKELADLQVDVINISLGSAQKCGRNERCQLPVHYHSRVAPAIQYALKKAVPVVVSAGNSGNKINFSSMQSEGLIVVGSLDNSRDHFSNYGNGVDIYAPGTQILSLEKSDKSRLSAEGTSFSAPQVAAAIGWLNYSLKSKGKKASPLQLKKILLDASQNENGRQSLSFSALIPYLK